MKSRYLTFRSELPNWSFNRHGEARRPGLAVPVNSALGRTREAMARVYRSKIDAWLVAVLAIAIVVSLFAAFSVLAVPSPMAWAVAAFTATIGAGLPLWLLLSTRYTLGNG